MSRNGAGFTESIVHARAHRYEYRTGMGMIGSAEFFVIMDDFDKPFSTNVPQGWLAAIIDTGATAVADTGAVFGATGAVLFDSDNGSEGAAIYKEKCVQLTAGKRFFMEMRFNTEAADDTDVQFGLTDLTATTNPEDLWTTTAANLVAFGVLDGDATVTMLADASNSGSTAELGTIDLVSGTNHTLAIYYNGSQLSGFVDGRLALTWSQASTTIPTGVALAPFFGFRNGSTANNEGHCDFVRIVIER